jgi:hypothetical protein
MVAVTRILFSFLGSLVSCCFEVESDGANESVEVVGDTLVEAIELGVRSRARKRCGSSHVPLENPQAPDRRPRDPCRRVETAPTDDDHPIQRRDVYRTPRGCGNSLGVSLWSQQEGRWDTFRSEPFQSVPSQSAPCQRRVSEAAAAGAGGRRRARRPAWRTMPVR